MQFSEPGNAAIFLVTVEVQARRAARYTPDIDESPSGLSASTAGLRISGYPPGSVSVSKAKAK